MGGMCRADRRTQATSQSQIPKLLQLIVKKTIIVLGAVPYCIFASKKIALLLLREYVKSLPDLKIHSSVLRHEIGAQIIGSGTHAEGGNVQRLGSPEGRRLGSPEGGIICSAGCPEGRAVQSIGIPDGGGGKIKRVRNPEIRESRGSGTQRVWTPRGSVAWTVRTQEPQRVETSINPMLRIRQDI
jgi:hypothetical protein